jgi:hypothetical protein
MASQDVSADSNFATTLASNLRARIGAWPVYRICAAALMLVIGVLSYVLKAPDILLILAPLILGSLLVSICSDGLTTAIDRWEQTFERRGERAAAKEGKFAKYFARPLWSGSRLIWRRTENIADRHFRAGIRLAAVTCYFGLIVPALALVAYLAITIIIYFAVMLLVLWLLAKYLRRDEDDGSHPAYIPPVTAIPRPLTTRPFGATSQKVEGMLESRVEHYDDKGQKVAECPRRPGETPKIDHDALRSA